MDQVGSYAVSTIDFDNWVDDSKPKKERNNKQKRTKNTKPIVNPVFDQLMKYVDDKFWVEKLRKASYGQFPRYFYFNDGFLSFKKANVSQFLELKEDSNESANRCVNFMRDHGGIYSKKDELELMKKKEQESINSEPIEKTWLNSNKSIRESLLSYYLTDIKERMDLSNKERSQLSKIINYGIFTKHFGNNNIIVKDNRIYQITGLLWNENTRKFYIDPSLKPIASRVYSRNKNVNNDYDSADKDMIPQFNVRWKKLVDQLDKKQKRYKDAGIGSDNISYEISTNIDTTDCDTTDAIDTDTDIIETDISDNSDDDYDD